LCSTLIEGDIYGAVQCAPVRPSRPAVLGIGTGDSREAPASARWWVLLLALVLASYGTGVIATLQAKTGSGFVATDPFGGNGDLRIAAEIMDVPSPPRNLEAVAGDISITLNWEEPANDGGWPVLGYNIYKGTCSECETLHLAVPLVTSWVDLLVESGVTYYYQVTAVNLDGESDRSNEASATPGGEPPTVPGPPTNLEAAPGNGTVTLTWSAPEDDGGRPITNYHIWRGTSPDGESKYDTVEDVHSYTDSGATNGETYYYKVSAQNEVGEGGLSNEASATPEAPPTPPGPPLDLQATAGDGIVALSWSAPADDGGSPITNYNIWRGTTEGQLSWLVTLPDVRSYRDADVTNGVTYYYHVTAVNSAGEGAPSNEVSATPMSGDTVPEPPVDLVAVAGDARVSLSWQKPPDGGSPITAYNIYRGTTQGGEKPLLESVPADSLAFTDSTVTNGQTYYYYVTAVNAIGESDPSNEVSATPSSAPTVPDAVQNLRAEAGDSRVTLTWSPPERNGGKPITNYKVYRGTSSGDRSTVTTIGNVTSHTDLGLENGNRYYYVVAAVNEVGDGPPAPEVSATPATVPGVPQNLAAIPRDAAVTVQWSDPVSDGGADVELYRVFRGTTSGSLSEIARVAGTFHSYEDSGLENGQTYFYQVSAVNRVGEGPRSPEVSAAPTQDVTVPSAPQNLVAAAGNNSVQLTWSPPATNGGSPIIHYWVYRGEGAPENLGRWANAGNVTSLLDGTALNGVTYFYQVSANNSVGEGPFSTLASATPRPGPDRASPSVEITPPRSGEKVTAGQRTFYGNATDDTGVRGVRVSADGKTWIDALGTDFWSATLTLPAGVLTIHATATDVVGNVGTTNLIVTVEPGTTGGSGSDQGAFDSPGPFIIVSAVLSFAITAVTAWFFLNRRRTRY
jgi:fibronectin type 3 domain-containing protein